MSIYSRRKAVLLKELQQLCSTADIARTTAEAERADPPAVDLDLGVFRVCGRILVNYLVRFLGVNPVLRVEFLGAGDVGRDRRLIIPSA